MKFIGEHATEILMAIIFALVVGAIFAWLEVVQHKHKDTQAKLKKYFEFTWKGSSALTPSDFSLTDRNYHNYYLTRNEDNLLIENKIHQP
jgi:hypothetical protein